MKTIGIVCEYNPFHNGHKLQIKKIREQFGENCTIVCAMSGNYVQRGSPAIFDKSIRANAALLSGADLVLELPVGVCLSSAEGFASGSVDILSQCCDILSFGTESMDSESLLKTANLLCSEQFSVLLREELETGCSFPAARQKALCKMGLNASLSNPNDILAVEYCKAILSHKPEMDIFPITRNGNYHAEEIEQINPSATSIRKAIQIHEDWTYAVPEHAVPLFTNAAVHTLEAGERAILSKLRTMSDDLFESLPYGSEGLWRKFMKASRTQPDLLSIINATKSKRYTRTRIDRMILCAFLGLTSQEIGNHNAPVRILAFNDRGRSVLRSHPEFINAGENLSETEIRIADLYGLFCVDQMEPPGMEAKRRNLYLRENE